MILLRFKESLSLRKFHHQNPSQLLVRTSTSQSTAGARPPKPNLREAGQAERNRTKKVISAACLLVLVYMYPQIIRPLFGLNTKDENKRLEAAIESGLEGDDDSYRDKLIGAGNRKQAPAKPSSSSSSAGK